MPRSLLLVPSRRRWSPFTAWFSFAELGNSSLTALLVMVAGVFELCGFEFQLIAYYVFAFYTIDGSDAA